MEKSDQTIDSPEVEDANIVEEVPGTVKATDVPVEGETATAEEQRPEEADAPVANDIPTTPGEIKDKAIELKDRAKSIGAQPIIEEVGGALGRLFGKINRFFDDVEGNKK